MIAQRFKNAAHDAVAARVDLDACLLAVGGGDVTYGIGVDGAIVEFNAVGDVLHVLLADGLVGPYLVDFLLDILRVGEFGCQVTVVGEQEHTGGVAVKSSHGIDAFLTSTLDEVHDGLAAVGIVTGGDAVFGLIEQDVALLLGGYDLAIIFYNVLGGNLHTEFGDYLAIDLDKALLDVFISHTARADAGVGHELVQANLHVGINRGLLIDDALGLGREAHLGLRTLLALGTLLEATGTLLIAALALLITTLALLIATLALLVTALALLIATLALLVTTLALLVTTLTLLVTTLTGLITTLAGLVTLTGLITALTGLVAALLLLFGIHWRAFGIRILLLTGCLWLLVAGLVAALTGLIATLAGLVTTLTLITTLTGLIALTLVATLAGLITTLTGLITLARLVTFLLVMLITFWCSCLFSLIRLMGAILYFFITAMLHVLIKICTAFTDSGSFRFFLILFHRRNN